MRMDQKRLLHPVWPTVILVGDAMFSGAKRKVDPNHNVDVEVFSCFEISWQLFAGSDWCVYNFAHHLRLPNQHRLFCFVCVFL
jgi:hypothetical protein